MSRTDKQLLDRVYKTLPTRVACVQYIEQFRWPVRITCAVCDSPKTVPIEGGERHHCNSCDTSFSVMVRTPMQGVRVELQKWIMAVYLIVNSRKRITGRELAIRIGIDKTTACRIIRRIDVGLLTHRELLLAIGDTDNFR